MKTTRSPFGSECTSTGNGYAFDASGAAGAEAATSAARTESSMQFLRGARMVAEAGRESRSESAMQDGFFGIARPEREAVLAGGLGFVHRAIGAVEELLRGVGSGFEPGHSDRRSDVQARIAF